AEDRLAVCFQQPLLGPRDRIPRQPADCLKEGRAELVVQILRWQLSRRLREVISNVLGKCADARFSLIVRNGTWHTCMDSAAETSYGTSVAIIRGRLPLNRPSSRNVGHRKSPRSIRGTKGSRKIREMVRRLSRSTPSHCQPDPVHPRRLRQQVNSPLVQG